MEARNISAGIRTGLAKSARAQRTTLTRRVDFWFRRLASRTRLAVVWLNPIKLRSMERVEEAKRRTKELRTEIAEHDRRYYLEAARIISDQEYEVCIANFGNRGTVSGADTPDSPTQRVGGAPLESFLQVTHRTTMLSSTIPIRRKRWRIFSVDSKVNTG